jgi:hypothetical protein
VIVYHEVQRQNMPGQRLTISASENAKVKRRLMGESRNTVFIIKPNGVYEITT